MSSCSPYYDMVPKDYDANLNFREKLIRDAKDDPAYQEQIWKMCAADILFYVNAFGWTFDPRHTPAAIPFITYEFQDEGFLEIVDAVGDHDLLIEKSRDMGVSWMFLVVYEHFWHFKELQTFLIGSRKEDLVDKREDPNCLFWKLLFFIDKQPKWLRAPYDRAKLRLLNMANGSTIVGESTNENFGRAGRATSVGLDEFASVENGYEILKSTGSVTDSRLFLSTPKGMGNTFYDLRQGNCKRLTMHWTKHPVKSIGLYYDDQGKPRSPWYDKQCKREPSLTIIAQELDIDYAGSDYQYFPSEIIDRQQNEHVRAPDLEGELDFERDTSLPLKFLPAKGGTLQLWLELEYPDGDGEPTPPADGQYVIGVDVSQGTGASNSVIVVYDKATGEKVAEYANPHILPEDLARVAVAIGWWFNEAFMLWDAGGPGRGFGQRVLDLGYTRVFYRRDEAKQGARVSDIPGYYMNGKELKNALFQEYRRALGVNEKGVTILKDHSAASVKEHREYIFTNQTVEHVRSLSTQDPSGAKANHGDRVVANALAWRGMRERPAEEVAEAEPEYHPTLSIWGRRQAYLKKQEEEKWW